MHTKIAPRQCGNDTVRPRVHAQHLEYYRRECTIKYSVCMYGPLPSDKTHQENVYDTVLVYGHTHLKIL
jgi:hypothetical protein